MLRLGWIGAAGALLATTGAAPAPALAGLSFLVGTWAAGQGQVADTGQTSRGTSIVSVEAGGGALLRRDHTDLFAADGKPAGSFEQVMLIYAEGGALHADYADGTHVIHYTHAEVTPGSAVTFLTDAKPDAPSFRLRYDLTGPKTLTIAFAMAPPGGTEFRPVATGSLTRAR